MIYKRMIGVLSVTLLLVGMCGCQGTQEVDSATEVSTLSVSNNTGENQQEPQRKGEKVSVAIVGSPQDEILKKAENFLIEEGYWINPVICEDINTCMEKLALGDADVVYGGHVQYLEIYNDKNNTEYVSLGAVHYEPMVIYARDVQGLQNISDGAKIAIPQEEIRASRALFLLAQEGVLTLREDVGNMVTVADITDNPYNVSIEQIEEDMVLEQIGQYDFTIGSKNYALLQEDYESVVVCGEENTASVGAQVYGCLLITAKEKQEDKKVSALQDALQDKELQSYMEAYFLGSVLPLD